MKIVIVILILISLVFTQKLSIHLSTSTFLAPLSVKLCKEYSDNPSYPNTADAIVESSPQAIKILIDGQNRTFNDQTDFASKFGFILKFFSCRLSCY